MQTEYLSNIKNEILKNLNQKDLVFIESEIKDIEKFLIEHHVESNKKLSEEVIDLVKNKRIEVLFDVSSISSEIKSLVSNTESKIKACSDEDFGNLLKKFKLPNNINKASF